MADLLVAQKVDSLNKVIISSINKLNIKKNHVILLKNSLKVKHSSDSATHLRTRTSSIVTEPHHLCFEDESDHYATLKSQKQSLHPSSPSHIKLNDDSSNSNYDFNDIIESPIGKKNSNK